MGVLGLGLADVCVGGVVEGSLRLEVWAIWRSVVLVRVGGKYYGGERDVVGLNVLAADIQRRCGAFETRERIGFGWGRGGRGMGKHWDLVACWVKSIGFGGALQRPFSMQSLRETVPLPSHLE